MWVGVTTHIFGFCFVCVFRDVQFGLIGLFCLLLLQDLWAAASGLDGSVGIRWSAVHGSVVPLFPSPQIQQLVAVSLILFALRL
jgi:hypothetical protein